MAGTYRVVWEFAESNGATFQEVYYREAGSAAEAALLQPALQAARLNLLAPLNTFLRVRSANTTQQRDTAPNVLNKAGTFTSAQGPVPVGAAVICTLAGVNGGTRKLWLRGCSGSAYTRDGTTGKDILTAYMSESLTTFFAALQAAGYGMRRLTPANSNNASPFFHNPILSVDGTANNGTSVVTFKNAITYPNPGRVVIGGASKKDAPSLNGHFQIIAAAGVTLTIPYQTPQAALLNKVGGYVRQEQYSSTSVFVAAQCGFGNLGTRTSKSPLSRSRGARRAQRIRLSL